MNELSVEPLMSTKELSEVLGVSNMSIKRVLDKTNNLNGTVKVENGKTTYFTEKQATLIKKEIASHHNLESRHIDSVTTEFEENETILKALTILQTRNEILSSKVTEMQPKAEVYDAISDSTNLTEIGDFGRNIQIGYQNIFKILQADKIIMKKRVDGIEFYEPYYDFTAYFKAVIIPFEKPDGTKASRTKLMLNQKGVLYFTKKYSKEIA